MIRSYDLWASESEPEKTWYHYASDEQGSTIFITDKDKICNRYDYDAWGNLTTCEEIIPNRYLYTGQQFDQITQQYYLRARYYNPVIARFTQEDIYRGDGLNLYTYCDNNPVIYYDPSGYVCTEKYNLYKKTSQQNSELILYRGERSSVRPDEVFSKGIKSKGTGNDIMAHTRSNTSPGDFVSTSSDINIAKDFAGKNGYVYEIKTKNYIDVNKQLGNNALYPEQKEFSVPGGIKAEEIKGVYIKKKGVFTGEYINNPNFKNTK